MVAFSEKSERRWLAERKALLDTRIGLLACALRLVNSADGATSWIPNSGGRFLATGVGCPRQSAHNDFSHKNYDPKNPKSFPGYFVVVSGDKPFPLWILPGSHLYPRNQTIWRRNLIGLFSKMQKIVVPKNSMFIGHGLLTHAGGGWEEVCSAQVTVRYHTYLRPHGVTIKNQIYYFLDGNSSYRVETDPGSPQHELYDDIMEPFTALIRESARYDKSRFTAEGSDDPDADNRDAIEREIEQEGASDAQTYSDNEEAVFEGEEGDDFNNSSVVDFMSDEEDEEGDEQN